MNLSTLSMILKALIFVCAATGVCLSIRNGGRNSLLYFTIQSNIWIAVVGLCGLIRVLAGKPVTPFTHICKLVFSVAITLTGFVYCFILLPVEKYHITVASVLTHMVVPVISIIDFIICRKQDPYQIKDILWTLIPPTYYLIFAAIGFVRKWNFGYPDETEPRYYPYFFLNWGSPCGAFGFSKKAPYIGTFWWIVICWVIVALFALILIGFGK